METNQLETFLESFSKHIEDVPNFHDSNKALSSSLKSTLKDLYDFTKSEEIECKVPQSGSALKKLIVDNFDLEQIWQQLELQNTCIVEHMVKDISALLVAKDRLIFSSLSKELSNEFSTDDESNSSAPDEPEEKIVEDDDSNNESASDSEDEDNCAPPPKKYKESVVDDEFFKLNEMEEFLRKEENPPSKVPNDSDSEEEDVDLFENDSDEDEEGEDEAKIARFKDYFVDKRQDEPKRKKNRLMEELEEENSGSEQDELATNHFKSSLESRQERLNRKIEQFEEQAISDQPWPLKGEITGQTRPQNSLLEQVLDFDLTSRPAPVITEQASLQLEDIIRQRIKDKAFDSIEKCVRPIDTPFDFKKKLLLDQEKSKESLANIYEKDYLTQQAAFDQDKQEQQEEEPESHKELKKMMNSLFAKLDSLSNFHFTATAAIPELKVIKKLPAVSMEEVAPVAVSDANLLAPEEIKNKPKGDIIGQNERTKTDKKGERRKKKLKQKMHSQRKAKIEEKKASKKKFLKV
ncbi:U3 small nucleolar ribonucleoprotein protein MPP10 [Dendroctonus ponderosae]